MDVCKTRLRFDGKDDFLIRLRQRVDAYFERSYERRRDCPRMYFKSAVVMTWLMVAYTLLVFVATTWWTAAPLAVCLGLAMAAFAFNVQHDGGHHAYSDRRWVNHLASLTLDLLGASSFVWKIQHNTIHHSYSNITGHDADIDLGKAGRLTPHQQWRPVYRFQHFYIWLLYSFVTLKWQLWDDFRDLANGHISGYRLASPRGWNLITLVAGKLLFLSLFLALPMLIHSWWVVLLHCGLVSIVAGWTIAVVIQLGHCVEKAAFPMPATPSGHMESSWALHQLATTVNYARTNPVVSWFTGGLNYQIEHHLFPRICHVNYPAISRIVERTCRDYGVMYLENRTVWSAIRSHFRWLRQMGQRPEQVSVDC